MNTQKQINNYIARQNSWIKANNIVEGTELIVFKTIKDYSKGWSNEWATNKNMACPDLVLFNQNKDERGLNCETLTTWWHYPYNCLKVAIDPAKTYIPPKELIKMRYYVETMNGYKFIGKIKDIDVTLMYWEVLGFDILNILEKESKSPIFWEKEPEKAKIKTLRVFY